MGSQSESATTRLRVAVVGCGYIGRRHARVVAGIPGVAVSVVVDPVAENAAAVAAIVAELGGAAPAQAATLPEALAAAEIDIVVVCTPSGLHAEPAVEALRAGKHTLIEKPIEVTETAAAAIAAASAAQLGLVASVISQHRFDRASQVVHAAIQEGRFGVVTSGVAILPAWRTQSYYDSGDWRGTWALDGGGSLMNQGVHNLDLLLWLMGEPVEVSARTALRAHENVEVEDTAAATIVFESGALATVMATTASYPGGSARIYLNGSLGSAIIDNDRLAYFHAGSADDVVDAYGGKADSNQAEAALGGPEETWPDSEAELEAGHRRQWDDFLAAVRGGGKPSVGIADATTALITIRAIYESARSGQPVKIADVKAGKYHPVTA